MGGTGKATHTGSVCNETTYNGFGIFNGKVHMEKRETTERKLASTVLVEMEVLLTVVSCSRPLSCVYEYVNRKN